MTKLIKNINIDGPIEHIDPEKIVLDEGGKFPRRLIIKSRHGTNKEYRIVKTQAGNFILNK